MNDQELVSGFRQSLERNIQVARERFMDLSENQFNWKPQPGSWSVGQSIQHINMVGRYWVKSLDRIAQEGKPAAGHGAVTESRLGRYTLKKLDPERLLKRHPRARSHYRPHFTVYTVGSMNEFMEIQGRLASLADRLSGMDMNRNKVGWYVLPMLRVTLGDTMRMVCMHTDGFLQYAQRVTRQAGFPAR